jgi:uncharacterized membrane protein
VAFRDRQGLREVARQRLETAAFDPQKLVLVYGGLSALVMLLVTGLNFVLTEQISGTGGLGGLGTRAALETAAQVLQTATNMILPFWNMGYLYCMLKIVRGQSFDLKDLLEGFRNFAPVLRLTFLYSLQFLLLAFCCLYPSMMLYMITPLSAPLTEIMGPLMESEAAIPALDEATAAAAMEAMIPMFILYAVMFLVVAAPRFYHYRLAFYALLDDPQAGARMALRCSTLMTHGRRLDIFKLDLSFWWFYVLDGLTLALCYGDLILGLMGISLPISADVSYFLFYVLYLAAQLGLYVFARNRVECTYAAGYDALRRERTETE